MAERPTPDAVAQSTADTERSMAPQVVPVNMYETDNALVVVAPMPAVRPEDVTIEVRGDRLRLWAHLRSAGPRPYLLHEWNYGGYEREVDLPGGYGSNVQASLANGQLAVRVLPGDPVDRSAHPSVGAGDA